MKIIRKDELSKEKKVERIPLYKDVEYMARLKLEFIARHNAKIQKKKNKSDQNNVM